MKGRVTLGVCLALLGAVLGVLVAVALPVTVARPHGCPSGAPRAACFGPVSTEHRYTEYGLLGFAFGGLAGTVLLLRARKSKGPEQ